MLLGIQQKQPADILDYDVDFSNWLPQGDTVTSATATASTIAGDLAPLTVNSVQVSSTVVKVWLSGGTDGNTYTVTVRATTVGGRMKEEDFRMRVKNQQ